ncbi:ABC transporter ATP-binding protein [Mesorhizobium sp. SP-1A]|uniref:ABC transporter ATP-binding protein n=1 Tax=Mesorhizobium sp. SP-1A TaxID=3077840 RepID=UPI0028F6C389|nr:ABC transporter ATP-binding protein [Mesorhizobium sp. SP-1A]
MTQAHSCSSSMQLAVDVRGLRVELPDGADIVDDVSFSIRAGEVLGVVGESGSGKTTVGMALLGFARGGARITGGTVHIAGDTGANMLALDSERKRLLRGKTVAYVPQDPASALNPSLRIGLQLAEVIEAHEPETPAAEIERRIADVMVAVGLPPDRAFLLRYPHQLSGGQQQRIGIAMAVILAPKLIVLDEPTTGLDVTTQNRILDVVKKLCREQGIGALHVTHDLSVIANIADHVMVMYSGRVVELGRVETVLTDPMHPYTRALLGAVPELRCRTHLTTIPGSAARVASRPKGCFFHPRCPVADTACMGAPVAIAEAAPRHLVRCVKAGSVCGTRPERLADPVAGPVAKPVLEVRDLSVSYSSHRVLEGISFAAGRGECLAIVGESGSGKSTLSRALIGLVKQETSTVLFEGVPLAPRARDRSRAQLQAIQYIFQSPHNSLNPRQTVEQLVGLVYDTFRKSGRRERREAIASVLSQVGLTPETMHVFPDQLSGGERQRVAIARALAADPEILVCDEITSALDVSVQAAIVNLLKDLKARRGLTMLFVTHNLALVRNLADRVLVLDKGRVAEIGQVGDVIDRPQHPYTRQLLANALEADIDHRVEAPRQVPLRA